MQSVGSFYHKLRECVRNAQSHIFLFLPSLTEQVLHRATGLMFHKTSLETDLINFTHDKNGLIDIISPLHASKLEDSLDKNGYKVCAYQMTDSNFVEPLQDFAESIAVFDGKEALVQPQSRTSSSQLFTDRKDIIYFMHILSQIISYKTDGFRLSSQNNAHLNLAATDEDRLQLNRICIQYRFTRGIPKPNMYIQKALQQREV